MKIIDTHSHLWLRQDAVWNGQAIRATHNGRAEFLGEEVQMLPPFLIDNRNTAEVFLSNMDYAQVSAAVVTQELIDGIQNDYLEEVQRMYSNRFKVCGMCGYLRPGFLGEARGLADRGFPGMAIPGHRLKTDAVQVRLNDEELMRIYHLMEDRDMFLSLTLAEGDEQVGQVEEIVAECPRLRIAIGHFGMPVAEGWMSQVRLARHPRVYLESGGITWLYNAEFYPFPTAIKKIREAIDEVGIDKLMWGSDYPRTITAITYRMSYDFVLKSKELSDDEKLAFLGGNAERFYGFEHLEELPYIKNMSE